MRFMVRILPGENCPKGGGHNWQRREGPRGLYFKCSGCKRRVRFF